MDLPATGVHPFGHSRKVSPFNYFSWDMIETIAQHGVPTVLVGVVRLYAPNIRFMNKVLDYDIRDHFYPDVKVERASIHFSPAETAYYYNKIRDLCQQQGMRFSTCYIGNDPTSESFYRYQGLWSNRRDCCDALGNVSAFKTTCASLAPAGAPKTTCRTA